jgi:hypothetical protein
MSSLVYLHSMGHPILYETPHGSNTYQNCYKTQNPESKSLFVDIWQFLYRESYKISTINYDLYSSSLDAWMFQSTASVSVFMQKRTRYHNSGMMNEPLFHSRRRMNHFLCFHVRFSPWAHWSYTMAGDVHLPDREAKPSYLCTGECCYISVQGNQRDALYI